MRALLTKYVSNEGHSYIVFMIEAHDIEYVKDCLSRVEDGKGWYTSAKLEILPDDEKAVSFDTVLEPCDCSSYGAATQGS